MAALRISLEAGRRESSARMGGAASAAARLADVVRGARNLPAQPVVCQFAGTLAPKRAGRDAAARAQSLSRRPAAIHPRALIRISVRHRGGTPRERCLVEA